jgi:hypothetical protein
MILDKNNIEGFLSSKINIKNKLVQLSNQFSFDVKITTICKEVESQIYYLENRLEERLKMEMSHASSELSTLNCMLNEIIKLLEGKNGKDTDNKLL